MVYYDKFGAYIPFGQEERYYKDGLMSCHSEAFYKVDKRKVEREDDIFKIIKSSQEESKSRIFFEKPEKKDFNVIPDFINPLKKHGID